MFATLIEIQILLIARCVLYIVLFTILPYCFISFLVPQVE